MILDVWETNSEPNSAVSVLLIWIMKGPARLEEEEEGGGLLDVSTTCLHLQTRTWNWNLTEQLFNNKFSTE